MHPCLSEDLLKAEAYEDPPTARAAMFGVPFSYGL
jgi:hypothetical protein